MDSEEKNEKINIEKVKIYINIEPLGLKFGYVFKKSETLQSIINFVFNQVKKLGIKFELGRINENKTGAILLTENIIGDFLENNDEITVYSEEYGFTRNNLPGEDEHSSLKKVYYLKSVSDLYKSMNFLKKKRNEKQKQKNNTNIKKITNEKKELENKDNEEEKEEKEEKDIDIDEEKEEKEEKNKQKVNNKNKLEKTDKKNKQEKEEKKVEEKDKNKEKEKTAKKSFEKTEEKDKNKNKEKNKEKTAKKTTEKKSTKKYLSSDDEAEENEEE
jgi:hypothetical protein